MRTEFSVLYVYLCVVIISTVPPAIAVPITANPLAEEINSDLMPCPKNWSPKAGRGPACRPTAEEDPYDRLVPCPKNWRPYSGRGPACRPTVKPQNIEAGNIDKNSGDNGSLMPCPRKWSPRLGKGPACRPVDDLP
ncbi:hypothetical protein EC968_003461 [Mortierella alpina]|nr:hypothetical protein EC968_003461 [Mortierella alpina]